MSQVTPTAEQFPTMDHVKVITFVSAVAVFAAAAGHIAGHGSDGFTLVMAALLLGTLRPWEPR